MKNSTTEMSDMHTYHVNNKKRRIRNILKSAQSRLNKYKARGSINMQEAIMAMRLFRLHVLDGQDIKIEAILQDNRRRANGGLATITVKNY
jgi:hypothetical protein